MTMRNVTMTCPNCGEKDRAVGDPDEVDAGHSGKWFCFNCKAEGTYVIEFAVTKGSGVENMVPPGDSMPDAHPDPDPDYQEAP
jgi:phage/plasmid primase-like uncharacterized protein